MLIIFGELVVVFIDAVDKVVDAALFVPVAIIIEP